MIKRAIENIRIYFDQNPVGYSVTGVVILGTNHTKLIVDDFYREKYSSRIQKGLLISWSEGDKTFDLHGAKIVRSKTLFKYRTYYKMLLKSRSHPIERNG